MDLNDLEKKRKRKRKYETLEEWENAKGLKPVDFKDVRKAVLKEYDCREVEQNSLESQQEKQFSVRSKVFFGRRKL